ncbi:sensor histidine kinase [Culicoidibacter larvae]|uniref:histidine kinase n=1 Tax=Culicoidibacter larvae TaxID=2579976 RepID=A0A5R8QFF1_9FIRM|nr:HAMP domain-containing sensor histidine kinase [Culicoidibacter larvae]TLG76735.1 HAMP domain-containing histidine kinase [Culicoidibacter larvae]
MYSLKKRIQIAFIVFGIIISILSILGFYLIFRISVENILTNSSQNVVITYNGGTQMFFSNRINTEQEYFTAFWLKYNVLIIGMLLLINGISIGISFFAARMLVQPLNQVSGQIADANFNPDGYEYPAEIEPLVDAVFANYQELYRNYYDSEQFQSYAAHELRNELLALIGMVESGTKSAAVEHIQLLNQTIDDLLILSQLKGKQMDASADVALVVAEVIDSFSDKLNIYFDLDEFDEPLVVAGKASWIYRAVFNLLENALRFGEQGGPAVVGVYQQEDAIVIVVSNRIAADNEVPPQQIWDARFTTHRNGHGIGLQLVKHVAELLNGYAYHEAVPGRMSFFIALPAEKQ